MAIYGYNWPMRTITISELKNNLSAEIKKLKETGGLQVLQRDIPVARLLPIADESATLPYHSRAKGRFRFLKPVVQVDFDPVEILLEDRYKERI